MKPYYMVLNTSTKFTQYKHDSYGAAKAEAIRLARVHAGQEFVVLAATASIKMQDVVIDEVATDDLPF